MVKKTDPFLPESLRRLNELETKGLPTSIKGAAAQKVADEAASKIAPAARPAFRYLADKVATKQNQKSSSRWWPLIAVVGAIIVIPIFILQSLFSPLAQLSTRLQDKYNYQEVATNDGVARIIATMVESQPSRYQDIGQHQQITPEFERALGRQEIKIDQANRQLIFKGKIYQGEELKQALKGNYSLIRAIDTATGAQRAMFQDSDWRTINQDLGVHQKGFDETAETDLDEQELKLTASSAATWRFNTTAPEPDENNQRVIENLNSVKDGLAATNQTADRLNSEKQAPVHQALPELVTLDPKVIKSQGVCGAYHTNQFLKSYQKTDQSRQLSKLATLFIVESEKARLGEIDSEVYRQLNDRLTASVSYTDAAGNEIRVAPATDSYAWQSLSGAVGSPPDANAEKYVIGANQSVSRSLSAVDSQASGAKDAICGQAIKPGLWGSFFDSIANFLGGLGLLSSDDDVVNQLSKPEARANATETTLKAMTGLATAPNMIGEDLSNAVISHAGYMYYRSAMASGSGFLTKTQAANLIQAKQTLVAQRQQYQQAKNPFDVNSPYSLVGSLSWQLAPILRSAGLANQLTKLATIVRQVGRLFNPATRATSQQDLIESLSYCDDPDYRAKLGNEVAFNEFCVPVVGTASTSSELGLEEVFKKLEETGNLEVIPNSCDENGKNCQTTPAGDLLNFQRKCLNYATISLETGDDSTGLGQDCSINSSTRELFGPYFINQRLTPVVKRQKTTAKFISDSWPVPGFEDLSSPFGPRLDPLSGVPRFHNGIDIPAPTGTPTIALEDGVATIHPMPNNTGYGNYIEIQAGDHHYIYAHLSQISVKNGAVKKGQVIGEIGSTGYSTGPHLHLEIRIKGEIINPLTVLKP